jgi:hypothetical protein
MIEAASAPASFLPAEAATATWRPPNAMRGRIARPEGKLRGPLVGGRPRGVPSARRAIAPGVRRKFPGDRVPTGSSVLATGACASEPPTIP